MNRLGDEALECDQLIACYRRRSSCGGLVVEDALNLTRVKKCLVYRFRGLE